jgi:hypothetical protein
VGTANAGVARFSADPPPFRRYRRPHDASGLSRTDYIVFAYEDTHGVVWAGTKGAINRIDLKTGRYASQPIGENTEVGSIAEDREGQFWIGTFDGSLFRFNPVTQTGSPTHITRGRPAARTTKCALSWSIIGEPCGREQATAFAHSIRQRIDFGVTELEFPHPPK